MPHAPPYTDAHLQQDTRILARQLKDDELHKKAPNCHSNHVLPELNLVLNEGHHHYEHKYEQYSNRRNSICISSWFSAFLWTTGKSTPTCCSVLKSVSGWLLIFSGRFHFIGLRFFLLVCSLSYFTTQQIILTVS